MTTNARGHAQEGTMTNDERAAIAREVLTELANWNMARVETLKDAMRFRDEHYPAPAPAAHETVTVTYNSQSVKCERHPDAWHVGGSARVFLDCWEGALLSRIAADARRIAELERDVECARNNEACAASDAAEWRAQCERAERERDEARRALKEYRALVIDLRAQLETATSQGEGLPVRGNSAAEEPSRATVDAAPAPIPPVATRETVERVARAIFADSRRGVLTWDTLVPQEREWYCDDARAALRALGYTIQEGT